MAWLGRHPHDQLVAAHTARHVAVERKGQPAEHPLLGQPGPVAEQLPDPDGQPWS